DEFLRVIPTRRVMQGWENPAAAQVRVVEQEDRMRSWMTGVCETNGVKIHYLRTGGSRPPVALLHGLTGSGACWSPFARALEGEFDVVMPDARGHGNSSAPHHGYRYQDHASDV